MAQENLSEAGLNSRGLGILPDRGWSGKMPNPREN
jgi:hypothetical protein